MSISVYTTTYNALEREYCVIEGIKSALNFADEIVVVDTGSTDGTVDAIRALNSDKINIYQFQWLDRIGWAMYKIIKSIALAKCTSDWCVLMDADECFHERDYEKIKRIPNHMADNIVAVYFNTLHFYKDYRHLLNGYPKWRDLYIRKVYMVRNNLGIHHGNAGTDIDAHLNRHGMPIPEDQKVHLDISVFHYGHVRSEKAYCKKQSDMHTYFEGKEVKYEKVDWVPLEELTLFKSSHPVEMKERIEKWEK
jgi:glycosyltransferase involved in cell wall biosynthesis